MRKVDEKELKIGRIVKVKVKGFFIEEGESHSLVGIIMPKVGDDSKSIISYFGRAKDNKKFRPYQGYDEMESLFQRGWGGWMYEVVEVLEIGNMNIGSFDIDTYIDIQKGRAPYCYYETIYPTDKDRTRTIKIDDKEIEISEESYNQLKESLNEN
jgi:hypothetical protein